MSGQRQLDAGGDWEARLHEELRSLAATLFVGERAGHTLQPTALVSELWIKLSSSGQVSGDNKQAFLALAAVNIRRILVDHARKFRAAKRGGGQRPLPLDDLAPNRGTAPTDVLELDAALADLQRLRPRSARVVELRFFAGMQVEDIATLLGVTDRTVRTDWAMARAWLFERLSGGEQ